MEVLGNNSNIQSFVWRENNLVYKMSTDHERITQNEIQVAQFISHANVVKYIGSKTQNVIEASIHKNSTSSSGSSSNYIEPPIFSNTKIPGKTIEKQVSIWENVPGNLCLYDIIENTNYSDEIVWNLVQQTIFALLELQEKFGFVHGDLHFENILVTKSNDENIFEISNHKIKLENVGLKIVLIDFSNSICWKDQNLKMLQGEHWRDGEFNFWFDPFADLRQVLCILFEKLSTNRKGKLIYSIFWLIKTLFQFFDIDEQGLLQVINPHIIDDQILWIEEINSNTSQWIDLEPKCFWRCLAQMIRLPLEPNNNEPEAKGSLWHPQKGNMKKLIDTWKKIEKYCTNSQAHVLFNSLCNFAANNNPSAEADGKFSKLIFEHLTDFGHVNVHFETKQASKLLNLLVLVGEELGDHMSAHVLEDEIIIQQQIQQTKNILEKCAETWRLAIVVICARV